MNSKISKKPAALALGLVILVAPAALGSSRTVGDPRDASRRRVDIRSVSHGHHNGKLEHTVRSYERFKTSRSPCVTFETNGRGKKDFQACAFEGMTDLHQQTTKPNLVIKRPNRKTVVYVFRKRAIGRPDRYKWFVEEPGPDECPHCDRAPNSGLIAHDI